MLTIKVILLKVLSTENNCPFIEYFINALVTVFYRQKGSANLIKDFNYDNRLHINANKIEILMVSFISSLLCKINKHIR